MKRGALLALLSALLLAGPASGQQDLASILTARHDALPGGKHAYQETWLLPAEGAAAPGPGATVFAGRVTVYQDGARERLEIFPVENGELTDPLIVVCDGGTYHLVTRVGATPLVSSARAGDRLVALVLAGPPDRAPEYRVVPAPDGGVAAVVLRHAQPPDFDDSEAFALRLPQVGGGALKSGLSRFSAANDAQVTASAGARGVDQVQTPDGAVSVNPDPDAVQWMDGLAVDPLAFEAFKREARLSPYDALPAEGAE